MGHLPKKFAKKPKAASNNAVLLIPNNGTLKNLTKAHKLPRLSE